MKLVVQRVISAKVTDLEKNNVTGEIGKGLLILLGIAKGDTEESATKLSEKLIKLRILSDEKGKMNLSTIDAKTEILLVSQFTLLADTDGGNRPSFINAEMPDKADYLYNFFIERLRSFGVKTETGAFGRYMKIESVLDGPVTIILE